MRRKLIALLVLLVVVGSLVVLPVIPALAAADAQSAQSTPQSAAFPTPYGPYSYTLKEYTDADAAKSVSQRLEDYQASFKDLTTWQQQQVYGQSDYWQALILSLDESMARFPDSSSYAEWLKLSAVQRAWRWQSTGSIAPFHTLFQEALNQGQADPADLSPWLTGLGTGFKVTPIAASNLFGDNSQDSVFVISNEGYSHSIWALRGSKAGEYKVYPLYDKWFYGDFDPAKITIQDLTANRFNEIAIPHAWHTQSSETSSCTQTLDLIEWNRKQFVNLSASIDEIGVESFPSGDCLGFSFEPGPKNTQAIISTVQVDSSQRRTRYEFNGKVYRWAAAETVLDPQDDSPEWAFTAGYKSDAALALLEGWLNTWPSGFDQTYGPAAQDYFRFKLGTWYAFRGQPEQAIKTMEQVRDKPAHPEFKEASLWADTFLRGYRSRARLYQGCSLVMERFLAEREAFRTQDPVVTPQTTYTSMQETWGFTMPAWGLPKTTNDPRQSGREDPYDVCSLEEAFRISVKTSGAHSISELVAWLELQHIQWAGIEVGDSDGDHVDEWVMLLNSGAVGNLQLWVLFPQASEITAAVAANFDSLVKDLPTTWFHFLPEYNTPVHNLYVADEEIATFRVIHRDGQVGFEYPINGTSAQRYDWDSVHAVILIERALYEILTVHQNNGDEQTFLWDPKSWQIDLTGPSMDSRIDEIESLIFDPDKRDYDWAADRAALLLTKYIHEDEEYRLGYGPAHVRPRVMYLLGLAYEMGGRRDKSMLAYWKLWKEYPASPFARLAQSKLDTVSWK